MQVKQLTREEYLKRINKFTEYVNNHLDGELDINTLAEVSNFSGFHFNRIVKAFLGEPIGMYINRIRIETAARLLRYSDLPIQEISERIGYELPSSFSKAFKKYYGISAIDYRNNKDYKTMKTPLIHEGLKIKAPRITELQNKNAIYISIVGEYGNSEYGDAWNRLWALVKKQSLFTAGIECIGVSYDDPGVTENSKCRYEACLVVHKPAKPEGEVGVKVIEGGKFALFNYQGPYYNLGIVYDTIFGNWLPESGYQLRNVPCFEKYLNNPNRTEPDKLKTEIYLPIQ